MVWAKEQVPSFEPSPAAVGTVWCRCCESEQAGGGSCLSPSARRDQISVVYCQPAHSVAFRESQAFSRCVQGRRPRPLVCWGGFVKWLNQRDSWSCHRVADGMVWWFPGVAVPAGMLCPLEHLHPGHLPCCPVLPLGPPVSAFPGVWSSCIPPLPPWGISVLHREVNSHTCTTNRHPKFSRCQEPEASHTPPDSRGSAHFPELCSRHGC